MAENVTVEINDDEFDSSEKLVVSSVNRAIREMNKGGVVILIIPGEVIFSYDIPTHTYNSDEHLHPWLKAALDNHVLLLKCDDIKLQKVIEIGRQCHFDLYTVLDFPEQQVSGSAYSIVSSLPRILHSELEMFGKVKEASVSDTPAPAPTEQDTAPVSSEPTGSTDATPQGRFTKIARSVSG